MKKALITFHNNNGTIALVPAGNRFELYFGPKDATLDECGIMYEMMFTTSKSVFRADTSYTYREAIDQFIKMTKALKTNKIVINTP